MRKIAPLLALLALAAPAAAQDAFDDDELRRRFGLEPLPPIPYPQNNLYNPDRVELGRLLFFDPLLSGEMDTSCGTCHLPDQGMADGRQLAAGTSGKGLGPDRVLGYSAVTGDTVISEARHTMTIFNTAYNGDESGLPSAERGFMLWDGKDRGLEGQALRPIIVRVELRGDAYPREMAVDSVLNRIRANPEYVALFSQAFPAEADSVARQIPRLDCFWDPTPLQSVVTRSPLSRALSAFERELVTDDTPYDRYVDGDDDALSPSQKRGLELFHTKAACAACHSGPFFTDSSFRVQGVEQIGPGQTFASTQLGTPTPSGKDRGRFVTSGNPNDMFAFRVTTLRQIAETAPYMHDGALETLEDVIEFYDRGGGDEPTVDPEQLDPHLVPLGLSDDEKADLLAFMHALTDTTILVEAPQRVPSGLPPVSNEAGRVVFQAPAAPAAEQEAATASAAALHTFPNPFNAETVVSYSLPRQADVHVALYDNLGQRVRTLFSGRREAGHHRLQWDGRNDAGQSVGSGTYILRVRTGDADAALTRRLTLIR